MNFSPRPFCGLQSLSARLLAFLFLAGVASAATALDSTRYYPLRTGNQWSYTNTSTGVTSTSTVGNPVTLSTGVLAFPVVHVASDSPGSPYTSYETSDQNGWRYYQTDTNNADGSVATQAYSPAINYLPPNPVLGSTYASSATVSGTTNNNGTKTTWGTWNESDQFQVTGFETVSNYDGTQSWPALKIIDAVTIVDNTPGAITAPPFIYTIWYVDGVGIVQYTVPNFLSASGAMETWKLTSTNVVPFSVAVSATITAISATVSTKITFNPPDVGKSGAVYVTAVVPPGTLAPVPTSMNALGTSAVSAGGTYGASSALTAATSLVLVQLTPSSWQQVVNGQLIPYASGVLGDQLAAQMILNNADSTILKGAQFCLGYGTSAAEMTAAGRMQPVATIPDPNAATSAPASCLVGLPLALSQGWNLLGNSVGAALDVATAFGDATKVTTVWKWNTATGKWAFFSPSLVGQALTDYASGKGYEVLSTAYAGEGVWVNAKTAFTSSLLSGAPVTAASFQSISSGWNLIAVGESPSPNVFNNALSLTPTATGDIPINLTTLWAWDATLANWYFYAPSLDKSGGLANYITSKSYLDFGTKVLDPTMGFWVNKP